MIAAWTSWRASVGASVPGALLLGALALGAGRVAGQDVPSDPPARPLRVREARLPKNPFAGAQEGDWLSFLVTHPSQGPEDPATHDVVLWEVAAVGTETLAVREATFVATGESVPGRTRTLDRKGATLGQLFVGSEGEFADLKTEEVARTIDGKSVPCLKVSCSLEAELVGVVWLEAASGRLVALETRTKGAGGSRLQIEYVVAGRSTGGSVEGTTAADLAKKHLEAPKGDPK